MKYDLGHHCPTADAITPIEDGTCAWCGAEHPKPEYRWDRELTRWVEFTFETDDRGVEFYEDGTVETLPQGWALCGTCERAWNDEKSTSVTPTPSARCPFEYEHADLVAENPESSSLGLKVWDGVSDRIKSWVSHLDDTIAHCDDGTCKDYQDLAQRRLEALTEARSLVRLLTHLTSTTNHDGSEMSVACDGTGLFWRYQKSGYHGGVIPHENRGVTTYGIHT